MVMIIWWLDLPMQSVPITSNVVSLNPAHGEVYSIQHDVKKFVRLVVFSWYSGFPQLIKLTARI